MSFSLPDIDINSWADYQKRELQRQMDEKVQSFGLEQAINEKMAGLHELAGGVQETFGGAAEAAGTALGGAAPAVGGAADTQMQQIQQAMAATQPTFDTPTQPARMPAPPQELLDRGANAAPMPGPPQELIDRSANAAPMEMDQQRQIQEALERTRPQLQQPAEQIPGSDDRMRQIQDMLGRTGQAVSEQLSRFTPPPGGTSTTGGGVNPNPTSAEVRAYITESAAARGIDPNIALRVANSEGGFEAARRGTFKTGSSWWPFQLHYGGQGYENLGTTAGMGNQFTKETGYQPGDPNAWQAATDYALDRAKQGGWGAWYGAKAQGIEGFAGIDRSAKDVVGGAIRAGTERVGQTFQDISQFSSSELTSDEAYAACGPAAAVRFAQRFGRNPSLKEALDMAKTVGWTVAQGMAGLGSQKALMDKLGIETQMVAGPQWDKFAAEAQTGNPVTISTSAHYFYADGYDPKTGAFHVGKSGTDLRGGSEWMTRQEIESAAQRLGGGNVQGALLANNPVAPASSTAQPNQGSTDQQIASVSGQGDSLLDQLMRASEEHTTRGRSWLDEQTRNLEQAVTAAAQDVTATGRPTPVDVQTAPLSTGAVEAVQAGALEAPARAALQSPLTPWGAADLLSKVGTSGAGEFYKSLPTQVESVETMAQLTEKYPSGTPGVPNLSAMSPEDKALWSENSLNVAAGVEPMSILGRMGPGAQRLRAAAAARRAPPTADIGAVVSDLGAQQQELAALMEQLTPLEERIARLAGGTPPAAVEQAEAIGVAQPGLLRETEFQPALPIQDVAGQVRATPEEAAALREAGQGLDALPLLRAGREMGPPTGSGGVVPPSAAEGASSNLLRRFAPEIGSAAAGGVAGWQTGEDLPLEERIARAAGAAGIAGLAGGQGIRRYGRAVENLPQIGENIPKQATGLFDEAIETKVPPMPSGWDYALSGSYFNLLSALPTHIRNIVGGAVTTATSPIEKLGAAVADPAARAAMRWVDPEGAQKGLHAQRERYFGEVPADIFGMLTSLPLGLRNALNRYADEITPEEIALERQRPELFKGVPGLEYVGQALSSPGKALRAEDGFFSTLNEYQAAYSMAYRQASQEGVKGWNNLADRVTDIIRNPSEDFLKEVQRQGKYRTFQSEGGIADSVARLRDKLPASKLIVPFVRTPINMTKFVLERSPVGAAGVIKDVLAAKVHKGTREALLNKPGGAAGDLADRMSRATLGSVAMGGMIAWAQGGNLTGKAPQDEAERDAFYRQGKQEYSFKSPHDGEWHSYKAMMPFSPIIATAADIVQLKKDSPDLDTTGLLTLAGLTFTRNMVDTQWTRTMVDVLDVMSGRGPNGENPEGFVEKLAAANVPGGAMTRSLARALDNTMYDPEGPAEAMLANIPGAQGLAQQFPEQFGGLAVKPKLDVFGRERKYPNEGFEAMYNVFPSTKPTEDPVELELKRLQTGPEGEPRYDVQPGYVSDRVSAFEQSVKLEPQQQQWYQQQSGQLSYALLQMVVGTPEWRAMNDEEKADAVDKIVSRSREAIRTQMEPVLIPQAITEVTKAQKRLGEQPTPEVAPTPAPVQDYGGRPAVIRER